MGPLGAKTSKWASERQVLYNDYEAGCLYDYQELKGISQDMVQLTERAIGKVREI
jgi:hypothetical protein